MEPLSITLTAAFRLFELARRAQESESCQNIQDRRLKSQRIVHLV